MESVRYIIVVHGMGEARKNETVLSVINRFAEARAQTPWPEPDDVLTLGKASSQTGRVPDPSGCRYGRVPTPFVPWLEFGGIPRKPEPKTTEPFIGERGSAGGVENLRFADAHWADLLAEDFPDVGQDPIPWTDGLLGRLRRKDEQAVRSGGERVPEWALRILELIQQTVGIVHGIARVRAQEFDTLVFDKYLGDVQLYGEFAHSRGRALRRFHRLMKRIEKAHDEEEGKKPIEQRREARYTVIAHSLGTVMSMDALLYACAKKDVRTGTTGYVDPNLPYPAYISDADLKALAEAKGDVSKAKADLEYLDTSWIQRVDSFVTLGSPIDKFLFIWWMNYSHLAQTGWMDLSLRGPGNKILHLNYCEEQDPVGHKLDMAKSAPAFKELFDTQDDRVYVRSAIPGLAHTAYWEDRDLFRWILHRAVDLQADAKSQPQWFIPKVYQKVLGIAYLWIPHLIVLASLFLFTWAWVTDSTHGAVIAAAGFSLTLCLGKRVMDLFLWWRQVLKAKEPGSHSVEPNTLQELGQDALTYLQGPIPFEPGKEGVIKAWEQAWFRIWLRVSSYGSLAIAGLLFGAYDRIFNLAYPGGMTRTGRAVVIAAVMGACAWVWSRLLPVSNQRLTTGRLTVLVSVVQTALALLAGTWLFQSVPAMTIYAALKPMLGDQLPRLLFLAMAYACFTAILLTYRYRAFRWIRQSMAAPDKQTTQPDFVRYSGVAT
jgi:hypothetical protein